jgi:protein-disulfide isomerase
MVRSIRGEYVCDIRPDNRLSPFTKINNMKLTSESKILLAIVGITIVVIAIAATVLTKPAPTLTRTDLVTSTAYTRGNPQAKTYLVEFSDFECPACLAIKLTVDEIIKTNESKLLFVYRNFPLDQHPFSHQAAKAAEAAGRQGKYWEMFDLLFSDQTKFSDALFPQLADQLQLDKTKFAADMADPAINNIILDDIAAGTRFGVDATPTFFLNGTKLTINGFSDLKTAVDQAINQ